MSGDPEFCSPASAGFPGEVVSSAPRLVFVGGSGRSGTTLMHKILCSNPAVAGSAEFDHLHAFMLQRRQMHRKENLARQAGYYDRVQLDAAWRSFIIGLLGKVFSNKPGATWLAEKTPSNVGVISDLLDLFPQAWVIVMVRDGRDVAASHLKIRSRMKAANPGIAKRWLREFNVIEVGRVWKRNIDQIDCAVADKATGSRVVVVRYEDLVTAPEKEIRRVCAAVGLPFTPEMLVPEQLDDSKTGHAANIDGIWYDAGQFAQRISHASIGNWRSMSIWNRMLARLSLDRYLARLGYVKKEFILSSMLRRVFALRRSLR